MARDILHKEAPILREKAAAVPPELFGTDELHAMLADMREALRATSHGVAIAAPQVGIPYRMFLVRGFVMARVERSDEDEDVAFINPEIVKLSRKKELSEEGCLSVPDIYGTVERAEKATVKAFDADGNAFERGGGGLLAQVFQHEVDHLEGKLFIDTATNLHTYEPKENDA